MIKQALLALAAISVVCFSLSAQETAVLDSIGPASFLALNQATPRDMVGGRSALGRTGSFGALNSAWYGSGPLTLVDGRLFSFRRAFGWMKATPADFLPTFAAETLPRVTPGRTPARDREGPGIDLLHQFDYVGGEVSVFYGRSTGKFKREVEAAYIFSEVVDGNTHISAGASYEHSKGDTPRLDR